jgi:hypothetical protein
MTDAHHSAWGLHFDDTAFPAYLLIRATGRLDSSFYTDLLDDLRAHMAATVGNSAQFVPLIFDIRDALPSREGLNTLHNLVRARDCRASQIVLWMSSRGPNSAFQHSVALMLRALMWNVHIVSHLDEAFALLGISMPTQKPTGPFKDNLGARFARWAG